MDKEVWKVWINRFETVAQIKHWDEETRLGNLIPRLQGKTGDFAFTQFSRHTLRQYSELIKELNSRFGWWKQQRCILLGLASEAKSQVKQLKNM